MGAIPAQSERLMSEIISRKGDGQMFTEENEVAETEEYYSDEQEMLILLSFDYEEVAICS